MLKNFKMDKSEEALPFKVFEPRSSSRFRSESLSSSSTSRLNLTVGSPVVASSPHQVRGINTKQQPISPGCGEVGCFDLAGLRRLAPRTLPLPSELLLASSSPTSSSLLNQDLCPMLTGFSGEPDLPKRLHVSNIPFRYR